MAPQQLVGDKVGSHIYSYSSGISFYAVHYNTQIFTKLGLSPPSTWPQFLDLCGKLTAAGKALLRRSKRLTLTAKGTFTPSGKAAVSVTKAFVLKRR